MLNAVGYIDLCIPRGGKKLINFVRDTAKVPVIETGAGVVHCYFDKDGVWRGCLPLLRRENYRGQPVRLQGWTCHQHQETYLGNLIK